MHTFVIYLCMNILHRVINISASLKSNIILRAILMIITKSVYKVVCLLRDALEVISHVTDFFITRSHLGFSEQTLFS